jgi:SepF-like predicted cell division protein (DUF552 family)
MGFLDRFRRKKKKSELTDYFEQEGISETGEVDDFIEEIEFEEEIPISDIPETEAKYIKVIHLYGLSDVSIIEDELKESNIIIADITPLKNNSGKITVELRRTVEQLRGIIRTINGDIAQLSDKYIIITPSNIKIWRRRSEVEEQI